MSPFVRGAAKASLFLVPREEESGRGAPNARPSGPGHARCAVALLLQSLGYAQGSTLLVALHRPGRHGMVSEPFGDLRPFWKLGRESITVSHDQTLRK